MRQLSSEQKKWKKAVKGGGCGGNDFMGQVEDRPCTFVVYPTTCRLVPLTLYYTHTKWAYLTCVQHP